MNHTMPIIQLTDLVKTYPDGAGKINPVLRGITLEVEPGEFVAIRGASGSGKTTLLSILGTLLLPDSGSYLLRGKEVFTSGTDYARLRNREIGFIFQDHRLMPQYTVLENILLPLLAQNDKVDTESVSYAK